MSEAATAAAAIVEEQAEGTRPLETTTHAGSANDDHVVECEEEEEDELAANSLTDALASRPTVEFEEEGGEEEEEEENGNHAASLPTTATQTAPYFPRLSSWSSKATAVTASWRKTALAQKAALEEKTKTAPPLSVLLARAATAATSHQASVPLSQASLSPGKQDEAVVANAADDEEKNDNETGRTLLYKKEGEEKSEQASKPPRPMRREYSSGSDAWSGQASFDDEEDDDGSSYVSSAYTNYTDESRTTAASRVSALQWAAAGLVDTTGSYFRGRYAAGPSGTDATPPKQPRVAPLLSPSQTARILSSPQAVYMQELLDSLESHQYIMLLGRGMLGVNLKQTFLKQHGVYVDFLVQGGAADRSGVLFPGDVLLQIGTQHVATAGTILTVPAAIAAAPRPVHLVFSTCGNLRAGRMTYLDVSVAMMHLLVSRNTIPQEQDTTPPSSEVPLTSQVSTPRRANHGHGEASFEKPAVSPESPVVDAAPQEELPKTSSSYSSEDAGSMEAETGRAEEDDDDEEDMQLVTPTSFDEMDQERPVLAIPISCAHTMQAYLNPGQPSTAVQHAYLQAAKQRNRLSLHSDTAVAQAAQAAPSFRASLQKALLLCVVDARRFQFLSRHVMQDAGSSHNELLQAHPHQGGDMPQEAKQSMPANAMLLLLVEMLSFCDLYHVTPAHRRLEMAQRLASKYFLPVTVGKTWVPPVFDFHALVPDTALRTLEAALKNASSMISQDLFLAFLRAAVESLADGPFLRFLGSEECARMRAYLHDTAPVRNLPLHHVLARSSPHAKNTSLYLLLHLLCWTERQGIGENDDIYDQLPGGGPPTKLVDKGPRVQDLASGLCAALWIQSTLLPVLQDEKATVTDLQEAHQDFWAIFCAPSVGALSSFGSFSNEAQEHLQEMRRHLLVLQQEKTTDNLHAWQGRLRDPVLIQAAQALADELVYDYAVNQYAQSFRGHKLHEWLCEEWSKQEKATEDESTISDNETPPLPAGSIKRLLRKLDFPVGLTPHKPSRIGGGATSLGDATTDPPRTESLGRANAECAVVFGSTVGMDHAPIPEHSHLCRYTCQTVSPAMANDPFLLTPDEIPTSLEGYAVVPSGATRSKPFCFDSSAAWQSDDGWQVSLVNFCVPRSEASGDDPEQDASLYGVSLLLQRQEGRSARSIPTRLVVVDQDHAVANEPVTFASNDDASVARQVHVSTELPVFAGHLAERPWLDRVGHQAQEEKSATIALGVALVSRRNVIFAMRETLTLLLRAFATTPSGGVGKGCGALIQVLGNFAHLNVEPHALRVILEPFLRSAAAPWIERPIGSQKQAFEQMAGQQLLRSLPPIPLALLFVTALLEQKVVISSSRRSVLLSATTALSALLKPLQWCHLLVPRVPANLAADLMQYPAPFILGMASDDDGIMDLIRDLPVDVTLVDLDVGRVILAPSFAHDSELGRGQNADTAQALRSQVLYLAQSLGSVFGACLDPVSWSCDMPLTESTQTGSPYDRLKVVCGDFLTELLSGTTSCCYWIQEAPVDDSSTTKLEPTILFDEDRFFRIKNVREQQGFIPLFEHESPKRPLALALDDFDLVLELFLRCQSMNDYIGTRDKRSMAFC